MARPQVLERLRELGWTGPTSYTLPYLNELIARLEGGETPEAIEASRRKTSVKTNGPRRDKGGTWEPIADEDEILTQVRLAFSLPENDSSDEVIIDDVRYEKIGNEEGTGWSFRRWVPTPPKVKTPKEPKVKGTWEAREWPGDPTELPPLDGEEVVLEGRRWRHRTNGDPGEGMGVTEVFVPTPPKAPRERKDPQAEFDPRELLRTFEDETLRGLTGGYDLTLVDTDVLQAALDDARMRSLAQATVPMPVGEAVHKDVVWLEALITVKRRLAAREAIDTDTNGEETEDAAQDDAGDGSTGS